MGFRIATNIQAIAAQRTLGNQRTELNKSFEKLSSGERINRAADDAAGLAISEKFKAEIRSTRQAVRNTQDAISLVQVAEGGLNEIGSILIRMRELSIQSASDTLSDTERNFTNQEVQALQSEVDRIANATRFNGVELLKGRDKSKDADMSEEELAAAKEKYKLEFQVGTGSSPLRDRIVYNVDTADSTSTALGLTGISTATKISSQSNLEKLDDAISRVSANRANFGAMQNRLQATMNNLMVTDENMSAANSRIRDVDVAAETAELTKRNILVNAGVSTLAQANQNGVLALKLI